MRSFKHILVMAVGLLLGGTGIAQDFSWAKEISGTSAEEPIASVTDAAGNTIVAGIYTSQTLVIGETTLLNQNDNETFFDIFLVKYDAAGNVLWAKTAGSAQHDYPRDVAIDAAGNIYLTGYFGDMADFDGTILEAAENFVSEAFLIKYNPDGVIQWIRQSQGSHFENFPETMAVDPSGNIYVCGNALFSDFNLFGLEYIDEGDWKGYVLKLDTDGNVLWLKEFWYDDEPIAQSGLDIDEITVNNDGSRFVISGNFSGIIDFGGLIDTARVTFTNLNHSTDLYTVCYDAAGDLIWYSSQGAYELGGLNETGGLAMDANNNTYLTGRLSGIMYFENGDSIFVNHPDFNDEELFLIKLNSAGEFQWVEQVAAADNTAGVTGEAIAVSPNGNCYITGVYEWDPSFGNIVPPLQNHAMFVAKYNSNGQAQWVRVGQTSLGSEGIDLGIDANENVYSTGHFTFQATFGNNATLDNAGLRGTYVTKIGEGSNHTFDPALASNWKVSPNPAQDFINVDIQMERNPVMQLDILDQSGRLHSSQTISKSSQVNLADLPAGFYVLRLQTENHFSTKKIIKQ